MERNEEMRYHDFIRPTAEIIHNHSDINCPTRIPANVTIPRIIQHFLYNVVVINLVQFS